MSCEKVNPSAYIVICDKCFASIYPKGAEEITLGLVGDTICSLCEAFISKKGYHYIPRISDEIIIYIQTLRKAASLYAEAGLQYFDERRQLQDIMHFDPDMMPGDMLRTICKEVKKILWAKK